MGKYKGVIPLLVAVIIIVAAILIIQNPFGGGSSEDDSGDTVLVFDAPEGSGTIGAGGADNGQAEPNAAAADPTQEPSTSPYELPTVDPTTSVDAPALTATPSPPPADGPIAPEVAGIKAWINSQPLMVSDLRGKVVLVDFWTYTCVNCIRTFPYLKLWHAKYADDGLVILGVHTPEFNFEKKPENVRQAVRDYGIGWPVALDNDYDTWRAYENRYWPAKYLIDKDGVIRYIHFGEGAYTDTELIIRQLLKEAGADLSQLDAEFPADQTVDPTYLNDRSARVTRELYAGWDRGYSDRWSNGKGYVGQQEYFDARDTVTAYEDTGERKPDLIYLQGPWYNSEESLRHARETPGFEDYMALEFSAKSVNVVIRPEGEGSGPFKVLLTLDGEYMTDSNKGEDVVIEDDGRSFIYVDEPRLYSIVQAESYGSYGLKLSSNSPRFAVFAFTFGVYESGV